MKQTFPGFLYAKSLHFGDAPQEGYRTWFSHSTLAPHLRRMESLRDSFCWRTDSNRRHPPVIVVEPIPDGNNVLVIRFSDTGKDSFGRSQTLRMEALLVPADAAARFWNGTFVAEPDADRAEFHVDVGAPASAFPGFGGKRLVNGNSADFSLDGRAGPFSGEADQHRAPSPVSTPLSIPKKKAASRDPMKIPFFIALLALFASLSVNAWLHFDSSQQREELQSRLSQTESELENLRAQMAGLERDKKALEVFQRQSNDFESAVASLKHCLSALETIRESMQGRTDDADQGD